MRYAAIFLFAVFLLLSPTTDKAAEIIGTTNSRPNSSGGSVSITNSGTTDDLYGSFNTGFNSSGGSNIIINSGTVNNDLFGSVNLGVHSSGGGNWVMNLGTVKGSLDGSYVAGPNSSGGGNIIINSGTVLNYIDGSDMYGSNDSGGGNTIINSGYVGTDIEGDWNAGSKSSGGSNTIINSGTVVSLICGSCNVGPESSGGYNTIINSGIVDGGINPYGLPRGGIYGSFNGATGSSGGNNTIINSGTVNSDIVGSYNSGTNSSGGSNTIINYGTVYGSIWGSKNVGPGSSGGNNTITNAGSVSGSIYGGGGNDTIILVGGSFLGGIADGGGMNNTLGFNNMGTVDGSLLGTKYLDFQNLGIYGGTTLLTGTWNFSGGTTMIHNGNLFVNGDLITSLITVDRDGLLGGNGRVDGSVVFTPGSIYFTRLYADGNSDRILVNGPVMITGATVEAWLSPALYSNGRSWRILTATGGIQGAFSSVDVNSSTITLQQEMRGDEIDLVVVRMPYAVFGATGNQSAVGSALDRLLPSARGTMADLLVDMDFAMTPAQITDTLHGLNPEMYTAFPASGLEIAASFSRVVSIHQQEAEGTPSSDRTHQWNVWGEALGDWLNRDGQDGVSGYTMSTGGAVIGMDRAFGSVTRAGLALGYSNSTLSWTTAGNSGRIDGKHLGIYGSTSLAGFYLDGIAGYTSLDNSASRSIATPAFTSQAADTFGSGVWEGNLSCGYDVTFGSLRLGPIVSIDYQHLSQDGINESGAGDFDVRMHDGSADSLITSLGLRLTDLFKCGSWRFLPLAELNLLHQFKNDAVALISNFADYPDATFTVTGADPAGNEALAILGLSAEYGRNLSLYLNFSATLAGNKNSQLLAGGATWTF